MIGFASQNHVDPALHLFVDDAEIYQVYGLRRAVNRPRRLPEPVLRPTEPWEEGCRTQAWGSVVAEPDGLLRLWYLISNVRKDPGTEDNGGYAYAESRDGIHWEKPSLGLIDWRGSTKNNLFFSFRGGIRVEGQSGTLDQMDGFSVIRDDDDPDPSRRYKLIANMQDHLMWARFHGPFDTTDERIAAARAVWGQYMLTSPDGIGWSQQPRKVRDVQGGDYMMVTRDYRRRRWWINERCRLVKGPGFSGARTAGLASSEDPTHWPEANEMAFVLGPEEGYGTLHQHHGMTPFNYGDLDLGFLEIWSVAGQGNWCELACHRDGQPWQRVMSGTPFLDIGPEGSFDRMLAYPTHNPPIRVDDQIFVFYSGLGRDPEQHRLGYGAIGLATIGLDRFVSLARFRGNEVGGAVTTPITVTGPRLCVNLETTGAGWVKVALKRPDLSDIPGFGLADCEPLSDDQIRAPVIWKGGHDLSAFLGQPVVIHFQVNEAALYGYRFGDR